MKHFTGRAAGATGTVLLVLLCSACTSAPQRASNEELVRQVTARETAFAATMAARDVKAFGEFVADDAVFIDDGKPLRGKAAVLAAWTPLFKGAKAPFSWRPELVVVVGAGDLAESTGPVFDPSGKLIAHYRSNWRRDVRGVWHIELDNGYAECACTAAAAAAPVAPAAH